MMTHNARAVIAAVAGLIASYLLSSFIFWDFFWMPEATVPTRILFVSGTGFLIAFCIAFTLLDEGR